MSNPHERESTDSWHLSTPLADDLELRLRKTASNWTPNCTLSRDDASAILSALGQLQAADTAPVLIANSQDTTIIAAIKRLVDDDAELGSGPTTCNPDGATWAWVKRPNKPVSFGVHGSNKHGALVNLLRASINERLYGAGEVTCASRAALHAAIDVLCNAIAARSPR